MKNKIKNIETIITIEEKFNPMCDLILTGNKYVPSHRARSDEIFKYICQDSRIENCPFGYIKKDIRACLYKK